VIDCEGFGPYNLKIRRIMKMSDNERYEVVIIGAGPAGLTASIYARRAGLSCLVIEQAAVGGNMFVGDRIENYPGFPEGISGSELSQRMEAQARKLGVEFIQTTVNGLSIRDKVKEVNTDKGSLEAQAVIVATGCQYKKLGIPGEGRLLGRGVSYCATCDGNFFRNQTVAVIGGGDAAVQEALYLSKLASKVYIIHRRDQLRAVKALQEMAFQTPNIQMVWDTVAEAIEGEEQVDKLKLLNKKTGERSELKVEGVFIYVGIKPNIEFLKGMVVELTEDGYIRAGEDTRTSVPGIFAAGDVRKKPTRQIASAVGDGCNALTAAEEYLLEMSEGSG
jgi:thioredoxin reductase (NADPH)